MAVEKDVKTVLSLLKGIDKKISSVEKRATKIPEIEKRLAAIERDIKLIKECVATENAEQFPRVSSSNNRGSVPMAAAGK